MLFRTRYDSLENPRTGQVMERLVLEAPDWVNAVALTPERQVVMVRQYRFGTGSVTLEIPGGVMHPGETPEAAARRELLEETGYTATRWRHLGSVQPNPAFQDNLCHHLLAEDARATHDQRPDPGEDLVVETVPLADLRRLILDGTVRHSLVITALAHLLDLRTKGGPVNP